MALEQFNLDGQVAIVTGAGKGVGQGIARVLAEAGATVVGTARTESDIRGTIAGIEDAGGRGLALVADAMSRPDSERVVSTAMESFGRIDILVNNVGGSTYARFLDITDEDFRHTFDWCVTSAFIMSQLVAHHMIEAGHGNIVNISSGSARFGIRALTAYCVAKGGLEALTRAMAQELAPKIRVNAIALGSFATDGLRGSLDMMPGSQEKMQESTPLASPGRRRRPRAAVRLSVHAGLLRDQRDLSCGRRHRLQQLAVADSRLLIKDERRMRRVVQFSTGNVGVHSLPAIIGRPDLELVGVHAASPDKIGRDAAELCGLSEPTGIIATDDIDALIALKPDCVVYTAQGETRPTEVIEQMSKFLAAGINIVATSMVWLVTPRQADDWLRVPLEQACEAGNASLYVNGIDPGYSGDTEVHSALSLVTRARAITVQEIFDYANYDDYEFTGKQMGFGVSAEDDTPMLFLPGVLTTMWGGAVRNLAEQLGVQLDEVRQRIEPWYTDKRIECKMATVEPGQMAAVKFAVEGVRDGVPVITMEHITRLTADSAPDWLYPPDGRPGVHRVVVDGDPRVELNTHVSHPGLDVTEAGCLSTAARVVNAIDWVCRAPAGLIAVEDIPAAETIRGLMW